MICRFGFLLVVMVLACGAAPITFNFTGTVTQVPIDDLYGDITFGDAVQISLTFEGTATDQIPGDPATASYVSLGAPYGMTVTFPTHVFTASDSLQIGIMNGAVDQYTVLATGPLGSLTLELFLQDNSGAVFGDDSLPLSAPLLSAFVLQDFHLHEVSNLGETQVDGQLTGVTGPTTPPGAGVPEPGTGMLLLGGLAGLIAVRRR